MSDEREFLECEIADAMESDEDVRPEVAAIIEARSERDSVRTLLAQREGELEALRGIRDLAQAAIEATDAAMRHPITESKVRASMNATAALRAALSDNQESPALTDKEA